MAGGAAPAPKPEELVPHPVKDQLPNVSYCITSPPPWREFRYFAFYKINPAILLLSLVLPFF